MTEEERDELVVAFYESLPDDTPTAFNDMTTEILERYVLFYNKVELVDPFTGEPNGARVQYIENILKSRKEGDNKK